MPPQVATETELADDVVDDASPPRPVAAPPDPDGSDVQPPHSPPADEVPAAPVRPTEAQAPVAPEAPEPASRRSVRQRIRARQLRARKVRRTIRHIDPWSVLKFSVFFFALVWMVVIMAGVVLWSLAVNSGLVGDFEDLVIELFDLTAFSVDPDLMFRVAVMAGGAMALGGALFMGVLAVLFNLLSDLLGGIRVSVIEEETARRIE